MLNAFPMLGIGIQSPDPTMSSKPAEPKAWHHLHWSSFVILGQKSPYSSSLASPHMPYSPWSVHSGWSKWAKLWAPEADGMIFQERWIQHNSTNDKLPQLNGSSCLKLEVICSIRQNKFALSYYSMYPQCHHAWLNSKKIHMHCA